MSRTPAAAAPVPGVRRALTTAELDQVFAVTEAATSSVQLLDRVIHALYDALLAGTGFSLGTLPPGQRINPGDFAVPASQLEAIIGAVTNRAMQWGTAAQLALDLINVLPSSYDDPAVQVPARERPDRRPSVHDLRASRAATDVIRDCTEHVAALARHHGAGSPIHLRAATSWLSLLSGLFEMSFGATTRVCRDGELSLTVTTSGGLVYGIIFHPDRRHCTYDGCGAVIGDDGTARPSEDLPAVEDHVHVPCSPVGGPLPGEWSFHS